MRVRLLQSSGCKKIWDILKLLLKALRLLSYINLIKINFKKNVGKNILKCSYKKFKKCIAIFFKTIKNI